MNDQNFYFGKMHLVVWSTALRPFCRGIDVLFTAKRADISLDTKFVTCNKTGSVHTQCTHSLCRCYPPSLPTIDTIFPCCHALLRVITIGTHWARVMHGYAWTSFDDKVYLIARYAYWWLMITSIDLSIMLDRRDQMVLYIRTRVMSHRHPFIGILIVLFVYFACGEFYTNLKPSLQYIPRDCIKQFSCPSIMWWSFQKWNLWMYVTEHFHAHFLWNCSQAIIKEHCRW